MFAESVRSTAFTSPYVARTINIEAESYGDGDRSLESTLRAVLRERTDTYRAYFGITDYSASSINSASASAVARAILDNVRGRGQTRTLSIQSIQTGANEKVFSSIDEYEQLAPIGFVKVEKVALYFRKSFRVRCYVNEDAHSTILIVDNLDVRKLHFIQCAMAAYMPYFFNEEHPVKEEELRVFKALAADNYQEYIDAINAMAEGVDFRGEGIKKMLNGFEVKAFLQRKNDLQEEINNINDQLESWSSRIRNALQKKMELEVNLMGYDQKAKEVEENHELLDYFTNNNYVLLEDVDDLNISFVPFGYLNYWNESYAQNILDNSYSDLYEVGNGNFDRDKRAKLFKAIFVDKTIRLRLCGAYKFEYGSRVYGLAGYSYPCEVETYMPNPHINEYHCLGQYEGIITELVIAGNYIMAIEQCIQSSRSLNMADGAVMRKFYERLFGRRTSEEKVMELPDGKIVNTKEAIEWLNEQEG